jgi:ubiquinone/menaquinone biosynthesis C-methylase UbiE
LNLSPGLTKQFDRIICQFWRDYSREPKQLLAALELVYKPKRSGVLGVVDFQKQNAALLIKFLDKFYNMVYLPWVHLLWSGYYLESVPLVEKLMGSFLWRDVLK